MTGLVPPELTIAWEYYATGAALTYSDQLRLPAGLREDLRMIHAIEKERNIGAT